MVQENNREMNPLLVNDAGSVYSSLFQKALIFKHRDLHAFKSLRFQSQQVKHEIRY